MTPKRKSYLINLGVGLLIGAAVFLANSQGTDNILQRLCDGAFAAAVMLIGYGGLVFCRNKGTFDMAAYSLKTVFHIHVPGASIGNAPEETFTEYRERKAKARRSANGSLQVGLGYLALSVGLLIAYYLAG